MTEIIVIGIVVYIIYAISKNKKTEEYAGFTNTNREQKTKEEIRDEFIQNLMDNMKVTLKSSEDSNNSDDNSIIDVTNKAYKIDFGDNLKKYTIGIPYWKHQYIYSYSEISDASIEQLTFYSIFKNNFLSGEYLDLEGNTNYAFILLFDLLNEYDTHKDKSKLESQLKILGKHYPKTKSYGTSFLIQKMESDGNTEDVLRLRTEERYNPQNYYTDYDYWKLGNKYKSKLSLNADEVNLLNYLPHPNNNFCDIEFCCIEVLKLYIAVISDLKAKYLSEGTTLKTEFDFVSDIVARKHFKYRKGSYNYNYSIESNINEFHTNIFKHCENTVRELYGHKRKLKTDTYYTHEEAKEEFDTRISSKVVKLLPNVTHKVASPDEATDIELYSQSTSRWKIKFEDIKANFKNDTDEFLESVLYLGKLNKKNPSVENIFFEASKFIAKYDKVSALSLYIHYLYYDLNSTAFNNKQLTKTIQKSLFKTNEQLHDFEKIVSELIQDKDLEKALKSITEIYKVKRKKIKLDRSAIKDVQQQHAGTVDLLNEYLQDDFEDENNTIKSEEINNEEIKIEITQKNEMSSNSAFLSELALDSIQISILELFSKNNFSMLQSEVEEFAKSKGVFKNQVIESINEICYEILDDVLIEEEDDYYTIIPEYFQNIAAK